MSGITLDDIANNEAMYGEQPDGVNFEFVEQQQPGMFDKMGNVLSSPTGEGSIGEYLEHPLNFNNSKGLAQIIRGVTGLLGNLNLAIVDIVFGFLRFSKEKKGELINVPSRGGNIS